MTIIKQEGGMYRVTMTQEELNCLYDLCDFWYECDPEENPYSQSSEFNLAADLREDLRSYYTIKLNKDNNE